jgi:glucan phosphorylase
VPRVAMFAGKAAPGYAMAKLIVRLINCVAEKVLFHFYICIVDPFIRCN